MNIMWLFFVAKRFDRFKGVMRAAAVVAFMSFVFTFAGARHARADFAKATVKIGHDLVPLADVLAGATTISLNGQKMMLRYDGSTKKVAEVLDAAEEACRAGDVKAPNVGMSADRTLSVSDLGVLRGGDDDEGAVLCFARGADTPEGLLAQLDRFKHTKDLGSLGKMRYVYAKKERGGSVVLAAITDDSFRLDAMNASATADAPGSDDPAIPRPPGSTRIFSAVLEGTPYAARVYRTRASERDVKAAYEGAMLERGFTMTEVKAKSADRPGGIGFERDGVIVILATTKDRDGSLLVSVGSIGAERPKLIGNPL